MPSLEIRLTGEGQFEDWYRQYGEPIHLAEGAVIRVTGLESGMQSGMPSVALGFVLPVSGEWVLAETSLRLFLTAADVLKARFGDPRT